MTFISNFLNLQIIAVTYSSYCPMSNLGAVSKNFMLRYFLNVTLLIASLINQFVLRVVRSFRPCVRRGSSLNPLDHLGVSYIRILMLTHKGIASPQLIFLNCIQVAAVRVLFINGDMECYLWWQLVIAIFFFTWILLFPLSLKISFNTFTKDKISFLKLIWYVMIPFAVVAQCLLNRNVISVNLQNTSNFSESEVKKILREIFEEYY